MSSLGMRGGVSRMVTCTGNEARRPPILTVNAPEYSPAREVSTFMLAVTNGRPRYQYLSWLGTALTTLTNGGAVMEGLSVVRSVATNELSRRFRGCHSDNFGCQA